MGKWLGPPHEKIKRCGAKTRSGSSCGHYAMKNGRCRYHGGKSTGAIKPHRLLKHGFYTTEAVERAISGYNANLNQWDVDYIHLYRLGILCQFQQFISALRNSSTTGNVKASTARIM